MNIPTFVNVKYTQEDGYLTSEMQIYNDELNNALQNGLSDDGWTIPLVTAAELADIDALTGRRAMPNGTMWVVSDASPQQLVVKLDGALRKVTTTAYP